MKKRKNVLVRVLAVFLAVVMMSGTFVVPSTAKKDDGYKKVERSYEIAVVYDNSGSMYKNGNQAWCRAKYAMEIFASMLDYDDGDKLSIFPMWEVTTDGSKPTTGGTLGPIKINSKDDIAQITNMYTVNALNTPFAPISEAHEYLQSSKATDKWLIVLTDGDFNEEARRTAANIDLQERLSSLASNEIKVQYLGFGGASALTQDESRGFYTKQATDTSLKDDLITICNAIFQRSILPENRLSGQKLELDLSMRSLIVFVQGASAKVDSLVNAKGSKVKPTLDSGQRKYSEIRAKDYEDAPVDTSLIGQVVTFSSCPAGTYTLNHSSDVQTQIFYEPDVKIDVEVTNSDGQVVDGASGQIPAGEYTITSKLVDAKTGEDVTNHELLGGSVELTTSVTPKNGETQKYGNACKIKLEPSSSTNIVVTGKYLGDYTITSKENEKLDWLENVEVVEPKVDLAIDAEVLQEDAWYKLKDHKEWKPIKVTATLDGQPLTDEQLAQTKLQIDVKKGLSYRYEPISGESAFNVYIGQDENGKYVEPKTGKYKMDVTAKYIDSYGKENQSNQEKVSFEIQTYDKIWRWLSWFLLVLLIIILILWWNLHKTFPKKITLHKQSTKNKSFVQQGEKQKIGKSFSLRDGANIIFSGTAQKVTPHYKRKSAGATIKVDVKNIGAKVKNLKVGATRITPDERTVTISDTDVVTFNNAAGAEKKYQIRINN